MAKKPAPEKPAIVHQGAVSLSALLSKKPIFHVTNFWLIGDTPLIVHAWSEKAKREMLAKQVKATKAGREARDPESDFKSSLYEIGNGTYGFPVTGIKNCLLAAAHKDKGIARSAEGWLARIGRLWPVQTWLVMAGSCGGWAGSYFPACSLWLQSLVTFGVNG